MKTAVIGCGLRTPLLIHGLAHSGLGLDNLVLHDLAPQQAQLMAKLGEAIAAGTRLRVSACHDFAQAVTDCAFVISSIRVGGMSARARDERAAVECGFAGQETTGPAGFAMALRTVPAAIEYARLVTRLAPEAWIINFTNPAGLITQAIANRVGARVVGICDTPAELFFRISLALREPLEDVVCDYFGLNHLGWVRKVRVRGNDVTARLLRDDGMLRSLYAADLFPADLIRSLSLIPTEYVFFYYRQRMALHNQAAAAATRGEELLQLNDRVMSELESNVRKGDTAGALRAYRAYLNRRNASYMHLEGDGTSAFAQPDFDWDPFEGATGYHRIALEAMTALSSSDPHRMVLNVANQGTIRELESDDVIEAPCMVDRSGPRPIAAGPLPESVRGLTIAVKTYERLTIEAAIRKDRAAEILALFTNPIVADWDAAEKFVDRLASMQPRPAAAESKL
jgi:6-phospho-beta-glucosidase